MTHARLSKGVVTKEYSIKKQKKEKLISTVVILL